MSRPSVTACALVESADGNKYLLQGTSHGTLVKHATKVLPLTAETPAALNVEGANKGGPVTAIWPLGTDDVLVCGTEGCIRQFNVAQDVEGKRLGKQVLCSEPLRSLAAAADGTWFAGGSKGTVFRVEGGKINAQWKAHQDVVSSLLLLEGGMLITASYDGVVKAWDATASGAAAGKAALFECKGHANCVTALGQGISPSSFWSGDLDGKLHLWTVPTPAEGSAAAADAPGDEPVAVSATAAAKKAPQVEVVTPTVVLVVGSPVTALASCAAGIVLGGKDGALWGLRSKPLAKILAEFQAQLDANFEAAKGKIEGQTKELNARAERAMKRRIAALRKQLLEAATAAADAAPRAGAPAGGDDGDADAGAADSIVDLSADDQARVAQYTTEETEKLAQAADQLQKQQLEKIDSLAGTRKQVCRFSQETVSGSSFCHPIVLRAVAHPVTAVAVDGLQVFVASEGGVKDIAWRLGVTAL